MRINQHGASTYTRLRFLLEDNRCHFSIARYAMSTQLFRFPSYPSRNESQELIRFEDLVHAMSEVIK